MNRKRLLSQKINDYKRLTIVAFFLFFLFCILLIQFYKVQIIQGDKWTKQALCQHKCSLIQPFMRGRFFSNNTISQKHVEEGQPLVSDVLKFHLYIDPKAIPSEEKEKIAYKTAQFFNLPLKEKGKVLNHFYKNCRSRKVIAWIEKEKKEQIEKWWYEYIKGKKIAKNALFFVPDFKRSYPFGSLLGPLLHTVQEEKDLLFQGIPTGGLELYFNQYLKGNHGIKEIIRSPRHSIGSSKIIQQAENGADIYLTINQYVQAIMEEELKKGIERLNAKGGWAVMMDPETGEIMAIAQYPFFELSNYGKYFNDKDLQEHTRLKAITDTFEPGSIFKPITLAICFKANKEMAKLNQPPLFSPTEKIATADGRFSGRAKPLKDGRLHHYLNMYQAIQKSSNVYMGQLIKRVIENLGEEWYKNALHEIFDFGKKTNIEYPSENPGRVPTPGKMHPNKSLEWSFSTPYSLAIGHNILINSLQLVRAYGILVNGGIDIHPTLIRKVIKTYQNGEKEVLLDKIEERKNKPLKRILDQEDCLEIIKAMKYTTKIRGSASLGDISGYTEAGKSGTSEKIIDGKYSNQLYISSFVGFAPVDNPKFVLLVVVDEPQKKFIPGVGKSWHGGVSAAPIFKEIGQRTLEYLGVEPDDPFGYPYGDPRSDRKKADWANEVIQLNKLYQFWNE